MGEEFAAEHGRGAGREVAAQQRLEGVPLLLQPQFLVGELEGLEEGGTERGTVFIDEPRICVQERQARVVEPRRQHPEPVGVPDVVLVAEGDERTGGLRDRPLEVRGHTGRRGARQHDDLGRDPAGSCGLDSRGDDLQCAVGRPVVRDNEFVGGPHLVEDARQLLLDVVRPVVRAQRDRDLHCHVTSASGPPRAHRGTFPP